MKTLSVFTSIVALTTVLASCGNNPTPQVDVSKSENTITQKDVDAAYMRIGESRPEAMATLKDMGFSSILELNENTVYTLTADKKLLISPPKLSNQFSAQGAGFPAIQESIYGIVAGRLSAFSKATLSCVDNDPFDGIEALATVTHTIDTLAPNGRSFGPFVSTTARGYGYAAAVNKDMGGDTTSTGDYSFTYLYEGTCDGARTLSRGRSIWNINGGNVRQVASLNLIPI